MHDASVENANSMKLDVGQSDVTKGSGRVRPPLVCICLYIFLHYNLFKNMLVICFIENFSHIRARCVFSVCFLACLLLVNIR